MSKQNIDLWIGAQVAEVGQELDRWLNKIQSIMRLKPLSLDSVSGKDIPFTDPQNYSIPYRGWSQNGEEFKITFTVVDGKASFKVTQPNVSTGEENLKLEANIIGNKMYVEGMPTPILTIKEGAVESIGKAIDRAIQLGKLELTGDDLSSTSKGATVEVPTTSKEELSVQQSSPKPIQTGEVVENKAVEINNKPVVEKTAEVVNVQPKAIVADTAEVPAATYQPADVSNFVASVEENFTPVTIHFNGKSKVTQLSQAFMRDIFDNATTLNATQNQNGSAFSLHAPAKRIILVLLKKEGGEGCIEVHKGSNTYIWTKEAGKICLMGKPVDAQAHPEIVKIANAIDKILDNPLSIYKDAEQIVAKADLGGWSYAAAVHHDEITPETVETKVNPMGNTDTFNPGDHHIV